MRVVTWNCNMGLAKKVEKLLSLEPDIAIIQECARADVEIDGETYNCSGFQWFGHNNQKGLGVLAFGGHRIEISESFSSAFHVFLPIIVHGPRPINLLAVWAFNHRVPESAAGGSGAPADACAYYSDFLGTGCAMVVGDFNNNVQWDRPKKPSNHRRIVDMLGRNGLRSAYHDWFGEDFGEEKQATFYFYRHRDKPYHIDYAFMSAEAISSLIEVGLGDPEEWLRLSDHVPLLFDLAYTAQKKVAIE